ncbi:MAG: heavy-metal-associated domain-containing protein [Chloroflexi bacterium]|nr:heavy-metal-associated domain-containing protein [Chloroflexota bacterium]
METITLSLPAMYADHHVKEVRRILLEMQGVEDVYASSSFHVAEIMIDPEKVESKALEEALDKAGYIDPLPLSIESELAVTEANEEDVFFRHTAAFEQVGSVVSFGQEVPTSQRPLWPCPGMGPIRTMEEV